MDSSWLKTQFELNPKRNKADLAKALGLEPPAISKILKGTRQIKAQEYLIMRSFFGLPVDGHASLQPRMTVTDTENPRTLREAEKSTPFMAWQIPPDVQKAQRTVEPGRRTQIYTIRETTMVPDFKPGERVLVDLDDVIPTRRGPFLISDGQNFMVRECALVVNSNPVEISVAAKAKNFLPQTLLLSDVNIIGRVMAKLQTV
ncbi:MAG: helix-turn-helix transcriptional regulator [Alphaproteobacteria bacterium]|nr:helix-turn-helix transcriptional regulator [Alphaproteobacteria bacterium]